MLCIANFCGELCVQGSQQRMRPQHFLFAIQAVLVF